MADSFTPNLNLTLPEVGASRDTWGSKVNADLSKIDSVFTPDGTGFSVGLRVGSGNVLSVAGTASLPSTTTFGSNYSTGDILYANSSTTLVKLPIGISGTVLTSSGSVPTWAPAGGGGTSGVSSISFGSTGLTPSTAATGAVSVAGTLAVANGGTGNTTYSSGQLLIGSSSTGSLVRSTLTAGSGISITNGNGSITIAASGTAGVSSISFGSTGLTPSTSSTGAVSVAGTLAVGSGGTGATTAANARTNLGLGTISTQAANSVSITGGSIEGLSTLRMTGQSYNPVANGSLNVTATTSFSVNATGLVHFASGIGNFATSTSVFQLQSGITPQAFGTTTWTNISDERIKKNLANYTFGLTELRQLQTVTYQFNGLYGSADDGKVNVGLIAQDVAETSFSSMVEPWKYTDPVSGEVTDLLSVNTSQLVFALINAVKELDARIKVLEARVV